MCSYGTNATAELLMEISKVEDHTLRSRIIIAANTLLGSCAEAAVNAVGASTRQLAEVGANVTRSIDYAADAAARRINDATNATSAVVVTTIECTTNEDAERAAAVARDAVESAQCAFWTTNAFVLFIACTLLFAFAIWQWLSRRKAEKSSRAHRMRVEELERKIGHTTNQNAPSKRIINGTAANNNNQHEQNLI